MTIEEIQGILARIKLVYPRFLNRSGEIVANAAHSIVQEKIWNYLCSRD